MALTVEWAAAGVIMGAIGTIGTLIYNRWMSYKELIKKQDGFNLQIHDVDIKFDQYQKDMRHYLEICEICRQEVREHHDGRTAEHVTPTLHQQIARLADDVADIKRYLMEHPRGD